MIKKSFPIDPETIAMAGGLATAAHVGQNLISGAFFKSDTGKKFLGSMVRGGFKHGLEGKKMSPTLHRAMTFGIGPETTADYRIANKMGDMARRIRGHTPDEQGTIVRRLAGKLTRNISQEPSASQQLAKNLIQNYQGDPLKSIQQLHNIPGVRQGIDAAMPGGTSSRMDRFLNWVKKVPIKQKPGALTNIAHGVATTAAMVAAPEVGLQLGLNATREAIGKSKLGRTFAQHAFERGFQGKTNKAKQVLMRTFVSPRAGEISEAGKQFRNVFEK
jgi:hypothetical protein